MRHSIRIRNAQFWVEHPALLIALTVLLGVSFWTQALWSILWLSYLALRRSFLHILLLAAAAFYGWFLLPPHQHPRGEITALFTPKSLQYLHSPLARGWLYKGDLSWGASALPCSILYRGASASRPLANKKYFVTGVVEGRGDKIICKAKEWRAVSSSFSLAELRYKTKEAFRTFLRDRLPSWRVASFLSSLTTGDVEDARFRYEFSRLGLQHLLAISGFHFAIVIAFCSFTLGLFLSKIWKTVALFIAISVYFVFVGSSPSVERSYLTALLYLLGQILHRPTNGLNLLGAALLVELLFDPFAFQDFGCQLSFLSCGAILLFYPLVDKQLQRLLPHRDVWAMRALFAREKHIAALASLFRTALGITLAVNLVLLPLFLYHFHVFPFLSLLYNLFIPYLVSVLLFSLLLALLFVLLFPPLASVFFTCVDSGTAALLDLISYPPLAIDVSLEVSSFPGWIIPAFLLCLLAFASCSTSSLTVRDRP